MVIGYLDRQGLWGGLCGVLIHLDRFHFLFCYPSMTSINVYIYISYNPYINPITPVVSILFSMIPV